VATFSNREVRREHKSNNANLSVTARSAGTDMSGGAINESIIVELQ